MDRDTVSPERVRELLERAGHDRWVRNGRQIGSPGVLHLVDVVVAVASITATDDEIDLLASAPLLAQEYVKAAQERDAAIRALENVRLLAMRMRRTDSENAAHLLRFCADAGVSGSVTRGHGG